jgi:hypothetical protein
MVAQPCKYIFKLHLKQSPEEDKFYVYYIALISIFVLGVCFESRSHCVAQAGLDLMILLFLPLTCWDYKHVPPCPAKLIVVSKVLM